MVEQHIRNDVVLCGRLAAPAEQRELPSGDVLLTARIIVDRDQSAQAKSRQRVDTIDCVAWQPRVHRTMRSWQSGDVVQIDGALRRRFYRGPAGAVSRTEVEVLKAKRLKPG
jgi:single-strand DNA-binding protein